MAAISQSVKSVYDFPCYIDDSTSLGWIELRAKMISLVREHGVRLFVIDYIQLMQGKQTGNREQEIASITRMCKATAKELDVPIIELAQLNRDLEKRSDKRPQLSDLRESGSIEQDANIVMFLYRPEYYDITSDENNQPLKEGYTEIVIAKNRDGSLGIVKAIFKGKYSRFEDFETPIEEPIQECKPKNLTPNYNAERQYTPTNEQEDAPF